MAGIERQFFDYVGRGVPYGPDDGTMAPWAVAASLPFAPEIVLPTLDYCIHDLKLTESNRYGFKASFNPTYPAASGDPHGWISPWHFGLNEGPTILMAENDRTGLLWQLMRGCPYIAGRLRRAGLVGAGYESPVGLTPFELWSGAGEASSSRRQQDGARPRENEWEQSGSSRSAGARLFS